MLQGLLLHMGFNSVHWSIINQFESVYQQKGMFVSNQSRVAYAGQWLIIDSLWIMDYILLHTVETAYCDHAHLGQIDHHKQMIITDSFLVFMQFPILFTFVYLLHVYVFRPEGKKRTASLFTEF